MSQTEKAAYFKALQDSGVKFNEHYRTYSTADLKEAWTELRARQGLPPDLPDEAPVAATPSIELPDVAPMPPAPTVQHAPPPPSQMYANPAPTYSGDPNPDPNEMAGQNLNTKAEDEVIRTDEQGRQWIQNEVLKAGYAKARGRRILTYSDPGTERKTIQDGRYTESFEVAGQGPGTPAQYKITLPSFQVGIYRDRRFPFRVVTYNGLNGFHLEDVEKFYGGEELVPKEVKRTYVANFLCYDIRTVVQAIQAEDRERQLTGGRGIR